MARGWESKSVESQQESARDGNSGGGNDRSLLDKEAEREKQNLLLSRAYVQHQIESAKSEVYANSLRGALVEIEQKLAQLERKG
jgi:hypothetical protein